MTVNCKNVQGRRLLHFTAMADIVADAEKVVASPSVTMLGNWPLERLISHITRAVNQSIDGFDHQAPWFFRMLGPFLKKRFLTKPMPPGFHLPKKAEASFFPPAGSNREALDKLRHTVARLSNEKMTAKHPVLGRLTHEEWTQLHLRHSELHLSFAVPQ